jgi:hypothetical protein
MHSWEYKQISLKTKGGVFRNVGIRDDLAESCNEAGREGWELVSAFPLTEAHGRAGTVELIFKRPR